MASQKISIKELNSYPGDIVLRVRSKDIEQFYNNRANNPSSDNAKESSLANTVTLAIIAETLEETSIVISKLNKNINSISEEILEKIFKDFKSIKENESDENWSKSVIEVEISEAAEDFEKFVLSLEGNETFKFNVNGSRKSDKKGFSSQVIFRSNGGADEILKALPLITNKDGFNRKVKKIIAAGKD